MPCLEKYLLQQAALLGPPARLPAKHRVVASGPVPPFTHCMHNTPLQNNFLECISLPAAIILSKESTLGRFLQASPLAGSFAGMLGSWLAYLLV